MVTMTHSILLPVQATSAVPPGFINKVPKMAMSYDYCRTPAVVSILLTPLPGSVSFDTPPPLHYISFFVFLHLCLSLWTDVGFFADDYYVAYGYWLLVV